MSPQFDLVIEAGRAGRLYWRDLWQYRGLLWFLAWRDILVLYKQTVIGVAWSILRPLLTIIIFTVIFGRLARFPSEGVNYAVLVCAAMLPWQMFANAVLSASNSLVDHANLVSKIYFPRLLVPASALGACLVDFAISLALLAGLMMWYGMLPTWRFLALPALVLMALTAALGAGLWFSALNVRYRDFRYVVPVVLQLGLYVSPVGFSSSVVPERWRLLYSLNPMVGVIDGFRWAVLGEESSLYLPGFVLSLFIVSCLLLSGIIFFRRFERTFADVI